MAANNEANRYAGFWPRLGAGLLDTVTMTPLIAVEWVCFHNRFAMLFYIAYPSLLIMLFYNVYLVKQFGGTPGKVILGLCIRRIDGGEIGYREAILRELPYLLLGFVSTLATGYALAAASDNEFYSTSIWERFALLRKYAPLWTLYFGIARDIWVWSEFFVMLTNEKRRAIHDFLAGTVVVVYR